MRVPDGQHDQRTPSHSTTFAGIAFLIASLLSFTSGSNLDYPQPRAVNDHSLLDFHTSTRQSPVDAQLYEATFTAFSRELTGRANPGTTELENNVPNNLNLLPGTTTQYVFSNDTIARAVRSALIERREHYDYVLETTAEAEHLVNKLEERQTSGSSQQEVFITVNTCLQPTFSNAEAPASPPQLVLYVSTDDQNQAPGPSSTASQYIAPLEEGFVNVTVLTSGSVYIGVSAPQVNVIGSSVWNYEVAASVDQPYHSYDATGPQMKLLDSDANAALLVTVGLQNATPPALTTDEWLQSGPPFSVFVTDYRDTDTTGLRRSYCGLHQKALIAGINIAPANNGVEMLLVSNQPGPELEQESYVPRLNASSTYNGYLAQAGNSTRAGASIPGGGGTVYGRMNFTTKRDTNCAVVFNLTFCSTVAYAVPANPTRYSNLDDLAALYDGNASSLYANFSYSLQQIACNTTPSAQYSLVKTCDDCAAAYKTWLCAVTIPRCADYTLSAAEVADPSAYSFLMPRNVAQAPLPGSKEPPVTNRTLLDSLATNSSRNNATIAGLIQPGPYRELLPCEDLCYDLVRSCPAALGFGCPTKGKGLEASYGVQGNAPDGSPMCSIPGAVYHRDAAGSLRAGWLLLFLALSLCLSKSI